jgi:hypothetical protein
MRCYLFTIALLAAVLALSAAAQAGEPPYAKTDQYRVKLSGFNAGTLIFESELSVIDGCSPSSGSQTQAGQLVNLSEVLPPHTPLSALTADLAKLPGGAHVPWLRYAEVHGVGFYYYDTRAEWVRIELYVTEAYTTTERYLATVAIDP